MGYCDGNGWAFGCGSRRRAVADPLASSLLTPWMHCDGNGWVWGKTASKIYGPIAGEDFKDNQLRFSLLCQAALEAPRVLNLNSSKYFSGPYGRQSNLQISKPTLLFKIFVTLFELDNIIRKAGILGIVNGMDVQEWNPLTDKYIAAKYGASTVTDAKPLLKEALQAEVGTGKKPMEKQLEQLEIKYPDKARGVAKFNVPLAHMITAGADFMLVPSRFEPCGLIQLHAMRYGTVPIVASTGGLVDTVKEGFTGFQMGGFNVECEVVDPADVQAIATTVTRALGTYGTPAFTEIIGNAWLKIYHGSEPGIDGEEIAPLAKENIATP
ncbi:hypothetical protein GBA52_010750 [Prunus armeniaca]|nr:hypothetical protein GBA52_010750 [Prunus armeniaca]